MLHRLALRMLPSLSLAVMEDSVRKRKRVVMFVPGLVAFGDSLRQPPAFRHSPKHGNAGISDHSQGLHRLLQ